MKVSAQDIIKHIKNNEIDISSYELEGACRDRSFLERLDKKYLEIDDLIQIIRFNPDKFNLEKLLISGIRKELQTLDELQEAIDTKKEQLKSGHGNPEVDYASIMGAESALKNVRKSLPGIRKKYRGMNALFVNSTFDINDVPMLDILDSRIIIDQRKNDKNEKMIKLKEIEDKFSQIKAGEGKTGMDLIFSFIYSKDLLSALPTEEFRHEICDYGVNKTLWQSGLTKQSDLFKEKAELKDVDAFVNKYIGTEEEYTVRKFVYPLIKENIEYVDVDKLVMLYAYRLIVALETKELSSEDLEGARQVLSEINDYCKKQKIPDNYKLSFIGDDDGEKLSATIDFPPQIFGRMLAKFHDGKYYNPKEIKILKEKIMAEEIYLDDIPEQLLSSLFTNEEYKKILFSNDRNFKCLKAVLDIPKETIRNIAVRENIDSADKIKILSENNIFQTGEFINLYLANYIDKEVLLEFIKNSDQEISFDYESIVKSYYELDARERNREFYERYIELCKDIMKQIDETDPGRNIHKEFSDNLMEKIEVTSYNKSEKESNIEQLEYLYKTGLLQLESIISWEDKRIVETFLKDGIIDYVRIEDLVKSKTISMEYAQNLLGDYILSKDIDTETRIKYIKSGLVPEEYVGLAYQELLINSAQAAELEKDGYFERIKYETLTWDELQEKAKIKLGNLRSLIKIRGEGNGIGSKTYSYSTNGMLIEPDAREKLFELLGAKRAESTELKQGDPFYNYEFYVLPDKDGEYGLESIVIAERYFLNKDKPITFATANATYFFKWRDLLYISKLKKTEIAKESKDIVYKANHIVTDGEEKEGSWANKVLTAIGKTMMGRETRKYNSKSITRVAQGKVKELYSARDWMAIKNHADDIDLGQYSFKNPSQNSSEDDSPGGDGTR